MLPPVRRPTSRVLYAGRGWVPSERRVNDAFLAIASRGSIGFRFKYITVPPLVNARGAARAQLRSRNLL